MPKAVDKSGQRYGHITVLEKLPERTRFGIAKYRCRCDCGTEFVATCNNLYDGGSRSCGCSKAYSSPFCKIEPMPDIPPWLPEHDQELIRQAQDKSWYDIKPDEAQSKEGKKILKQMAIRDYHREEARAGLI